MSRLEGARQRAREMNFPMGALEPWRTLGNGTLPPMLLLLIALDQMRRLRRRAET
jgi:hypothetical protein